MQIEIAVKVNGKLVKRVVESVDGTLAAIAFTAAPPCRGDVSHPDSRDIA